MVGEGVKKNLYDAASRGDLPTFQELLQGDPYVLDGVSFAGSRNLLHIATIWGQLSIVEEILKIHTQLAEELDSQTSSPLRIEIATKLLKAAARVYWSRDCHGMNPIHIAAMNGDVDILQKLIETDPKPAREKLGRGDTVLHLCVKHNRLEALEFLANNLGDLINEGNDDGDTVLHLAVRYNQVEIIEYLVKNNKIDKKSRNGKGETALQILISRSPDPDTIPPQIREILKYEEHNKNATGPIKWNDVIMVVAILIATMAFQAAVSPPGGVWQEDSSLHKAGEAVMASNHPHIYKHFVRANTVAFVSSMTTIILRTIHLPSSSFAVMTILTLYATWVSVASIAVSYGASMMVITPTTQTPSFNLVIYIVIALCLLAFAILIVGNAIRAL